MDLIQRGEAVVFRCVVGMEWVFSVIVSLLCDLTIEATGIRLAAFFFEVVLLLCDWVQWFLLQVLLILCLILTINYPINCLR